MVLGRRLRSLVKLIFVSVLFVFYGFPAKADMKDLLRGKSETLEAAETSAYSSECVKYFVDLFHYNGKVVVSSNRDGPTYVQELRGYELEALGTFEDGYKDLNTTYKFSHGKVWPQKSIVEQKIYLSLIKPSNGWTEFPNLNIEINCTFLSQTRGKPTAPDNMKFNSGEFNWSFSHATGLAAALEIGKWQVNISDLR